MKPGGDCVRVSGVVWHVINDNFALAEVETHLALFDTYDFYVSKTGTAADAGKSLKEVVTAGQVRIHPTQFFHDFFKQTVSHGVNAPPVKVEVSDENPQPLKKTFIGRD